MRDEREMSGREGNQTILLTLLVVVVATTLSSAGVDAVWWFQRGIIWEKEVRGPLALHRIEQAWASLN